MLRKRLSVSSPFISQTSNKTHSIIQAAFDAANGFTASTKGLTPKGKYFSLHFAEPILAEEVEPHQLVVTPVFYSGEDIRDQGSRVNTLNGDYLDACCIAYWKTIPSTEVTQLMTVSLQGFSTIDFDGLPETDAAAVQAHLESLQQVITRPPRLLVVRASKEGDVIPLLPPQVHPLAPRESGRQSTFGDPNHKEDED